MADNGLIHASLDQPARLAALCDTAAISRRAEDGAKKFPQVRKARPASLPRGHDIENHQLIALAVFVNAKGLLHAADGLRILELHSLHGSHAVPSYYGNNAGFQCHLGMNLGVILGSLRESMSNKAELAKRRSISKYWSSLRPTASRTSRK